MENYDISDDKFKNTTSITKMIKLVKAVQYVYYNTIIKNRKMTIECRSVSFCYIVII